MRTPPTSATVPSSSWTLGTAARAWRFPGRVVVARHQQVRHLHRGDHLAEAAFDGQPERGQVTGVEDGRHLEVLGQPPGHLQPERVGVDVADVQDPHLVAGHGAADLGTGHRVQLGHLIAQNPDPLADDRRCRRRASARWPAAPVPARAALRSGPCRRPRRRSRARPRRAGRRPWPGPGRTGQRRRSSAGGGRVPRPARRPPPPRPGPARRTPAAAVRGRPRPPTAAGRRGRRCRGASWRPLDAHLVDLGRQRDRAPNGWRPRSGPAAGGGAPSGSAPRWARTATRPGPTRPWATVTVPSANRPAAAPRRATSR